jgi:hypothetical protein
VIAEEGAIRDFGREVRVEAADLPCTGIANSVDSSVNKRVGAAANPGGIFNIEATIDRSLKVQECYSPSRRDGGLSDPSLADGRSPFPQ